MKTIIAEEAYKKLTGNKLKLIHAPKHWGTAVFLDQEGRQRIAALFARDKHFAWRLSDRDVLLKNMGDL
jgi:hypothetical protein